MNIFRTMASIRLGRWLEWQRDYHASLRTRVPSLESCKKKKAWLSDMNLQFQQQRDRQIPSGSLTSQTHFPSEFQTKWPYLKNMDGIWGKTWILTTNFWFPKCIHSSEYKTTHICVPTSTGALSHKYKRMKKKAINYQIN